MPLSDFSVLLNIFLIALILFLIRALPFLLFGGKNPPKIIRFIDRFSPPLIMAILVFYCARNVDFTSGASFVPYVSGVAAAVILHLAVKNTFVTIVGSTALYMILIHLI